MTEYDDNRAIADEMTPTIKKKIIEILKRGNNLESLISIDDSNEFQDTMESTDYLYVINNVRIASRIRTSKIVYRDLTIRCVSSNGGKNTEFYKLGEGVPPKWYFYGWCDENGGISEWMLIDVYKMKEKNFFTTEFIKTFHIRKKYNKNDLSAFYAYPIKLCDYFNCLIDTNVKFDRIKDIERFKLKQKRHRNLVD